MRIRYSRQPLAVATALFLMTLAAPVAAQSVWTGAVDDDWFKAGNWQDGVVPPNGSNPVHINTSTQAPVIDGNLATADSISIGNDTGSDASLVVRGGGTLEAGGTLIASSGSTGVVTVDGSGSALNTSGLIVGAGGNGTLTVRNGGTVETFVASIGHTGISFGENATDAVGLVEVAGLGSTFNAVDLEVGVDGSGTLDIRDGGSVVSESAAIGSLAGSTGLVTVGGSGASLWSNAEDIVVGDAGNGTLNISSGGIVESGGVVIARVSGSSGLVMVDGEDSLLDTSDLFVAVDESSHGTLSILNGGDVKSSGGEFIIGRFAGSDGLVSVDGMGSTLFAEFSVIGGAGNGTLNVTGGGIVDVRAIQIGEEAGSTGLVTINGQGSHLLGGLSLTVGDAGNGTLSISSGGVVNSFNTNIGKVIGSTGLVTVDGDGSLLNTLFLDVGTLGNGTLKISNHGKVEVKDEGVTIARSSGSSGLVTVEGPGSTLLNTNDLFVGEEGNGTLNVINGGTVESLNISIAFGDQSTGLVTVDGENSALSSSEDIFVGDFGNGRGTLNIFDGGVVGSRNGSVGFGPNAIGQVTVDGDNSIWRNTNDLLVGAEGNGALIIKNGGAVESFNAFIGNSSGSTGLVTVDGIGSTWLTTDFGDNVIGFEGNGTLNILRGGKVESLSDSTIGEEVGSSGFVTVNGAGSLWSTSGEFFVGDEGNGTLNIISGGKVESLRFSRIATRIGATGLVTVDGVGSTWSTEDELIIGVGGDAMLNIFNGGKVESERGEIAEISLSTGQVKVDGIGSMWSIEENLQIGVSGNGTLSISGSGKVESRFGSIASESDASIGLVTVDGAGSTWTVTRDLSIGDQGNGTLDIRNGGTVESVGVFIGDFTESVGLVAVDGIDSTLSSTDDLIVGREGNGALSISNGGLVTADEVLLTRSIGAIGSLSIGATAGEAAVAAGTLDTARVSLGLGSGAGASTLNFNHTGNVDGSDVVFGAVIDGSGTVNQTGPGTTVLTAANTYGGITTVSGGELRVDGSLSDFNTVGVIGDGVLSGAGSIGGDVFVTAGGTLQGTQGRTLTIADLELNQDATVAVALGAAGGAGLFHINNTFILDGTLQVTDLGGFGAGVYRLFDYDGALLDNGLAIGTSPAGVPVSDLQVQTSVAQQVNLVSLGGQELTFWDGGDASLHGNGAVDGGSGTWDIANTNWTEANGAVNGAQRPQPGFAIFQGTAGTVTVDDTAGAVEATGLQFASHGYRLEGDALGLTEAQSVIRVGDGSAASSGYTATIANALTGAGGLAKTDRGTLVLSGQNSYAGGTHIQDGVLQLGEGGTTGSITGPVINDGVLAFDRSDEAVFAGAISGSGHVRQQGSGATILTGAATYTGGTTIASGRLQVGNGGTAGSLAGNVANAGTLAFNRSDEIVFAGAISGSGTVRQFGTGTTVLTGANTYTGGTTIQAGTLQVGDGGTTGALTGGVANAGTLAFNRSNNATFAGVIRGTGAVQHRGTGTTTLSGQHTYTGATTVAAGTLAVDGSIASSSLTTVAVGARLQGTGTVGNTIVQGTIGPGNSIGTLTVDGDYTQATAATYTAELGAGTASDLLHVTGAATLQAGALLHVQRETDTTVVAGTRYTILTAEGGLSGRYTVVGGPLSAFLGANAAYDATHAFLDVTQTRSFASAGQTRNQIAAANGVERLGSGQPVFDAVLNLADAAQARVAFDQLSGEIHASTAGALREESRYVREAADNRLRTVGDDDLAPTSWGQLYGAWGRSDSDGNAGERDVGRGGFLLGHDMSLDAVRFGVIGGTGRTSVQVDDRRSKADSDSWHLGVYGGTRYGAWKVRGGVAYSGHDVETTRQVRFTGIDQSLRANYDARTAQAFAEASYALEAGSLRYEPFASVAAINTRSDRFAERGGSAALHGEESATDSTFATLGMRAGSAFGQGERQMRLHGTLGWQHGFGDELPTADLAFAGAAAFTVAGSPIARDAAVLEAGIDLQLSPLATLGVSYRGQLAEDAQEHSAQAQLQIKF